MTTLLTGATGTLGLELIKALLKNSPEPLAILIRGATSEVADKYETIAQSCADAGISPASFKGAVFPLRGDLRQPNLGINEKIAKKLTARLTGAIHCAADVNFATTQIDAVEHNIEGTRNLLIFLMRCGNIQHLGYVSTAYVSGKRTGLIKEAELEHDKGFVNAYEESKYHAELMLNSLKRTIPISIYRPSVMLSDSNGTIRKFNGVHRALELYYHNLVPVLPANRKARLNIVPNDYAADAIAALYNDFRPRNYHICAPHKETFTITELLEETQAHFLRYRPRWRQGKVLVPELVDITEYEKIEAAAANNKQLLKWQILRTLKKFTMQLAYPAEFDLTNILADFGKTAPQIRTYYEKTIAYCIKTNWGKDEERKAANL